LRQPPRPGAGVLPVQLFPAHGREIESDHTNFIGKSVNPRFLLVAILRY